jgi:hypothetical protein
LNKLLLPLTDAAVIYAGTLLIVDYWESNVTYTVGGHYPPLFLFGVLPAYIFIWLFSVLIAGGYDPPLRLRRILTGLLAGTVAILVLYALLPADFRFSRALIILSAIWGMISMTGIRFALNLAGFKNFKIGANPNKRYAIAGDTEESERVADLLRKTHVNPGFIGRVGIKDTGKNSDGFIGNIAHLADIISIYKIDEVIFCARDIPAHRIIDTMSQLQRSQADFKIAPPESLAIIGSNSISTSGDLYVIDINSISKINNRRNKRIFDIAMSLILLSVSPVLMWITKNPPVFLLNIFRVLTGLRTWIGYAPVSTSGSALPSIHKGILNPTDLFPNREIDKETAGTLNMLYARDYRITNDLNIILRGFRRLGRL